jgi:DNA-binding transcriptional ArsR family regulator
MPKKIMCREMSDQEIELIAARFRALGEASRLKLIMALDEGAKNVSQLVKATHLSQSNASCHLRTLTNAGVLSRRREKTEVFYALAAPGICELLLKVSRDLDRRPKPGP